MLVASSNFRQLVAQVFLKMKTLLQLQGKKVSKSPSPTASPCGAVFEMKVLWRNEIMD